MENIFEIKEEYRATVVGFNNSGRPLVERTDLDILAEMAQRPNGLARYFVKLPTMEQIRDYRAARLLGEQTVSTEPQQEQELTEIEEQEQEEEPQTKEPTEPAKDPKTPLTSRKKRHTQNDNKA